MSRKTKRDETEQQRVEVKHFDYLPRFDTALEKALNLKDTLGSDRLSTRINRWRCESLDYPDPTLNGCRRIMEAALSKLAAPLPNKMKLVELLFYARKQGVITAQILNVCNKIRDLGNKGSHPGLIKEADAEKILKLLDEFLRWVAAEKLQLIPVAAADPDDPVLVIRPAEEYSEIEERAELASTLCDNKTIEDKTRETTSKASGFDNNCASVLQDLSEMITRANEIKESIGPDISSPQNAEIVAASEALVSQCKDNLEALKVKKATIYNALSDIDDEIDEIISEHDFIKKLLHGDKQATKQQLDIMAFPKGFGPVTNILQINGGAGTGKTLCLLAKVIAELGDRKQGPPVDGEHKAALFICFNRSLANYVKKILERYEGDLPPIDIAHYDEFINQLIRLSPKAGYEHLAQYAGDAKYKTRMGITYDYSNALKQARAVVAKRHPEQTQEYYLNPADEDGLKWLAGEIGWIEARYQNDSDASSLYPYPEKAPRIGRGTEHKPDTEARLIILEIRQELNRLLAENGTYTITQATKRLLNSSNLPAYDVIAVDEIQDFSLLSIRLIMRFRRDSQSKVFLSGDENQKLYRRDFTWKELGEDIRGYTVTLDKNMRNSASIQAFSERLLGVESTFEESSHCIHVVRADETKTIDLLKRLSDPARKETTALIGNKRHWKYVLEKSCIDVTDGANGLIHNPGLYLLGPRDVKGLEFDNVVVDYFEYSQKSNEEEERKLRYVHFTRARKRLYVRYQGEPPALLKDYYPDFLV